MNIKKNLANKFIIAIIVVACITLLLEIFAFNFSHWYSKGETPVVLATDVSTDELGIYETDVITIDGTVKNIDVVAEVMYYDVAYVSVILTDDGDKYEYELPEYTICNGVRRSGFNNIYPFGNVNTIQVKVKAADGCKVNIESITANANIGIDFKPVRMLVIFVVLLLGYLVWSQSKLHEIYFDEKSGWQLIVTGVIIVAIALLTVKLAKTDELLLSSPWPHHKQYQELARSLKMGTVELVEQQASEELLNAVNPYDTIALMAENVPYSMDYAFYNGKYYAYFGIVPEVLFYYPYYVLTGSELANHQVMMILGVLLTISTFFMVAGLIRKYAKSFPYFFYILIASGMALSANFVYLIARCDIYNVPILTAVTCTVAGMGCFLEYMNTDKLWLKRICICVGAFAMAFVAGCRPQLLLLSGTVLIWFVFEDGFKNRKLFTKKTISETVLLIVPYILVAILVGWYNLARFGNVLDFGATYSLTTNDMNNRGFNMNRLLRSLYCFLIQPVNINADFPFLTSSVVGGNYMGKFLHEYVYGGILVANTLMVSIWISIFNGLKKVTKEAKYLVVYMSACAVIIAAFDANYAGVLFRYTCDFAPAFMIAATVLWIVFLDKSQSIISYRIAAKTAYICVVVAMAYAFLTFVASGGNICLANDNKRLFFAIAQYFKF